MVSVNSFAEIENIVQQNQQSLWDFMYLWKKEKINYFNLTHSRFVHIKKNDFNLTLFYFCFT